jgi:hypothetical protein
MVLDSGHDRPPKQGEKAMPKTVNKSAKVETAYGVTLADPVTFSYSYEELVKGDEIPAKEVPDADDLRTYTNQKRNAAARSSAQNDALTNAGVTKPTAEDPQVALAMMVKAMVAQRIPVEQATQIAKTALGLS